MTYLNKNFNFSSFFVVFGHNPHMKIVILKSEPSKIFQKKLKKKFLDAVWQYWRYLEVSPDQGGHFLSLGFLIWSPPPKFFTAQTWRILKVWGFVRIFYPHFELHFSKTPTFFTFPETKIYMQCTFQIPRTCS